VSCHIYIYTHIYIYIYIYIHIHIYIYIYTHTHTYTDILCLVFNMYLITVCLQYVVFIKQKARYRYLQKYFKYINILAVLVTC
jgi:hypothetical protein